MHTHHFYFIGFFFYFYCTEGPQRRDYKIYDHHDSQQLRECPPPPPYGNFYFLGETTPSPSVSNAQCRPSVLVASH